MPAGSDAMFHVCVLLPVVVVCITLPFISTTEIIFVVELSRPLMLNVILTGFGNSLMFGNLPTAAFMPLSSLAVKEELDPRYLATANTGVKLISV